MPTPSPMLDPTYYGQEVVGEGRPITVQPGNSESIAQAVKWMRERGYLGPLILRDFQIGTDGVQVTIREEPIYELGRIPEYEEFDGSD